MQRLIPSRRAAFIGLTLLLLLSVALGACAQSAEPQAVERDRVIFALDWVVFGRHTPYFVALENGYFSENNIEPTILRGFGSVDSTKRLAAGQADFIFADLGALVLARANEGLQAKMIVMGYGNGGHAMFYLEDRGIETPEDLVGKTIAGAPGASVTRLFDGFLEVNGINRDDVEIVNVDAQTLNPLVLSEEVDGMLDFVFNQVQLEKSGAESGLEPAYFLYADHDFPIYANGIITTEETLENNPDLARRFADAIVKGYQFTFENPTEACTIMRTYHPDIDLDVCEGEVALVEDLVMTDEAKANGIGYMDEARVEGTIGILREYLGFEGNVTASELYTNEYLP